MKYHKMEIYISTINYNGSERTLTLLESLKSQTDHGFGVIVIDNASEDADINKLHKWISNNYPKIILHRNEINSGFSGGANTGIRKALELGADWVVLLNNDTSVENDFISRLKPILEAKTGIIGLAMDEGEGHIAYGGPIDWLRPTLSHGHGYLESHPQNNDLFNKRYAIGGGMVMHKSIIEKNGYFDENYFLYFEDVDYSIRALKNNISILFPEQPVVHHSGSATTRSLGWAKLLRYHYRNALYFNLKNGPWWVKILVWPWSWIIVAKQIIKIIIGLNISESRSILSGVIDFYSRRMGYIE